MTTDYKKSHQTYLDYRTLNLMFSRANDSCTFLLNTIKFKLTLKTKLNLETLMKKNYKNIFRE